MYELKICHLYPDILNLYGDRGNIICMQKRMEWRGIQTEVTGISVGDKLNVNDYDLFFIGGGQDFEQELLLKDLASGTAADIRAAVEDEKVFLAFCGGYQMLGNYFKTWDGVQCDYIGALDLYTVGDKERMIGNYMYQMDDADGGMTVVGFENHSGKTYLSDKVRPMGKVLAGYGNNGKDGTEGARYKNVFATYSHGSLPPTNPKLADYIMLTALKRKYPSLELELLDDTFENNAHDYMQKRLSGK